MKSYALSRLAQQRLTLGDKFIERYPHDWLVWEPGAWNVPRGTVAGLETVPPRRGGKDTVRDDDPLCFVLQPHIEGASFRVGRAEGNDLVLSDETVSRNHCFLVHTGDTWVVSCDAEAKQLELDGEPVKAGDSVRIRSKQRLTLGHIGLTLMNATDLLERLDGKR
jgi:hypothetical protein